MDLTHAPEDEAFRREVRAWLEDNLDGEFAALRGRGGPGREHEAFESASPGTDTWHRPAGPAWGGRGSTADAG